MMTKQSQEELIDLLENEYRNIFGIAVLKDTTTVFEHYFNGSNKDDTVHIASVTKSILSILVGIAIDRGDIKSLEQKVLDFFPGYQIKKREKTLQHITLRHLVTMTAPYKFKYEPYTKVYSSEDWSKSVLDLMGGKSLGGDFKYTTVGLHVLSGILAHATGKSVCDFANEHLFGPLGIKKPNNLRIHNKEEHFAFLKNTFGKGWVTDPKGTHTAGWGLTLTTNDMVKIGRLYVNNGLWGNKQLVSNTWVKESTKEHAKWGNLSYGYLWWIVDGKENTCYAAIGDGGNIIYVDSKKNLVIGITSQFMPRAKDRIELINKHILPKIEAL